MKFICDVHIPIRLSPFLMARGAESIHINQALNGSSTPDSMIYPFADQNNCLVITEDVDLRNTYFLMKTPRKLIRICLGNISNDRLVELIESQLEPIEKLNVEGTFIRKLIQTRF